MKIQIPLSADGKLLHPAVQATALAKYSRSPLSITDILDALTEEEANIFQEKWTNGYGHSSVEELCTIPVCCEGVSIIASKVLEDLQRSGFAEKSSRYQVFTEDSFIENTSITEIGFTKNMERHVPEIKNTLFKTYADLQNKLFKVVEQKMYPGSSGPRTKEETRLINARVFDNIRYLLPAGVRTNLAIVANGRDIKYLCRKLLSHPLPELRHIGTEIVNTVRGFHPVLVSSINLNEVQNNNPFAIVRDLGVKTPKGKPFVQLKETTIPITTIMDNIHSYYGMSGEQFLNFLRNRDNAPVPSILRQARLDYHIQMDYGAYRDLQRHRRCEQYSEILSTKYGYVTPDDIKDSPYEHEYEFAMEYAEGLILSLLRNGEINELQAQYLVPLGYLHRSRFIMDIEELFYIVEIRTKPQGHISYRRICYEMWQQALSKAPELFETCKVVAPDYIGVHK